MDRIIKFRGRRITDGKWVYGFYVGIEDVEGYPRIITDKPPLYSAYEVDPHTVGQDTGLLDKNGKEIWEGDVVIILDDIKDISTDLKSGQNYRVVYWDGSYMLSKNKKNIDYLSTAEIDCEVIGNIYENPELLESEVGK